MNSHRPSRDIVVLGMSTWREWQDGFSNRSKHIVGHLRKNFDRTLYVDFLPMTWKRSVRHMLRDSHIRKGRTRYRSLGWKLSRVDHGTFVLTFLYPAPQWMLNRVLERCIRKLKFESPVLWSYHPYASEPFQSETYSAKVFDAVDDWTKHPSFMVYASVFTNRYHIIERKADVIFTVSEQLAKQFSLGNAVWVPNGVDVQLYQKQQPVPAAYHHIPSPRAVYTGLIQNRFDAELCAQVALALPDVQFVIVGPIWKEMRAIMKNLAKIKNVHLIGRVRNDKLPAYIQHAHVGIIPHKINPLTKSMDPMKLYEYLACGKPVVSTDVPMAIARPYIIRAHGAENFASALESMIPKSMAYAEDIRHASTEYDWSRRFEMMWDVLRARHIVND